MLELTGPNLGARQRELNIKIREALINKTEFYKIKSAEEQSDVDILYKIGVASKYKDIEYIIETLKSGDTLYISKALSCKWLYDDEYSHIINPEYLHEHVFPLMSFKMIRKLLTTLSMYLRDERAIDFYNYSIRMKHTNIIMKFMLFTSETFKLEALNDPNYFNNLMSSDELVKQFLGNSLILVEKYFNLASSRNPIGVLLQLRYIYFVSNVKYMEMVRKVNFDWFNNYYSKRLGLRISKHIIKKHKDEIYNNPIIYLNFLNDSMLIRNTTIADAKFYAKALFAHGCPNPWDFWNKGFFNKYGYLFDKIPTNETLCFIKGIFTDQYPNEEFEMTKSFYYAKFYELMTPEEREKWALRHVESGLEMLGSGNDYRWYKFVSFDKAFAPIKKYILVTVDIDKRTQIITTLVQSAKTDSELETLFDYYYKRHINEQRHNKEHFVDAVLCIHNVYKFSENCWDAFNKILYSLEVYNILDSNKCKDSYKIIALIYHIVHRKELPEALLMYLDSNIRFCLLSAEYKKLNNNDIDFIYVYLFQFYLDKIKSFDDQTYNDEVKHAVRKYIHFVLDLIYHNNKTREDIPEIVTRYIKLDYDEFRYHHLIRVPEPVIITEKLKLMKHIKEDKGLIISKLPLIKHEIMFNNLEFNTFLKIIRTYFSYDLRSVFVTLFEEILAELRPQPRAIQKAVYGLIQLADMNFKKNFMTKYVPIEPKIDYSKIDEKILNIQKSICLLACYSRPPVPLSDVTKYIKGDYVHFCLPMFNSYLAKLPKPACIEFIQSLLDTALSVQKHALRMAFNCFDVHDLRKLVADVWKKTKNVSMRLIIYRAVFNKIGDLEECDQIILFEELKSFTRTLHEEDDDEIFTFLTSDTLSQRFLGEYIEIAWNVVNGLPEKPKFVQRRTSVINCMTRNIYSINKGVIELIINNHAKRMLKEETHEEINLVNAKWDLLHKYVTFFTDENDFHSKSIVVMFIIKESIKMWDKVEHGMYCTRKFVSEFINAISRWSYSHGVSNYDKMNKLFERILNEIQCISRTEEILEIMWFIRVSIIARNVIIYGEQKSMDDNISTYVEEYTSLLITSLENDQCFIALFDEINFMFRNNLHYILNSLEYHHDDRNIKINNAYVLLCTKILRSDKYETYVFALKFLPCDNYGLNQKQYSDVLNKLKCYESKELKYYMYKKFVKSDYKFRDYIL